LDTNLYLEVASAREEPNAENRKPFCRYGDAGKDAITGEYAENTESDSLEEAQ